MTNYEMAKATVYKGSFKEFERLGTWHKPESSEHGWYVRYTTDKSTTEFGPYDTFYEANNVYNKGIKNEWS